MRAVVLFMALGVAPACDPGCDPSSDASVVLEVTTADGGSLLGLEASYAVDGGQASPCEISEGATDEVRVVFVCGYEETGDFAIDVQADAYITESFLFPVAPGDCHPERVERTVVMQAS